MTTWMKLEGMSEINQREKDKYCMRSFVCEILKKKTKLIEKETRFWLPEMGSGGWGELEDGDQKAPTSVLR